MKTRRGFERIVLPITFATISVLSQLILLPICLIKTPEMMCIYFEQFGLVPARIVENYELYRLITVYFVSGTPWQAIINAFLMFSIIETVYLRMRLGETLLQCVIVALCCDLVQFVYACSVYQVRIPFFAREYYFPYYGFGPLIVFFTAYNLRSGSVLFCQKVPRLFLSLFVLLIVYFVSYPLLSGWVWNLSAFVMGWAWPLHRKAAKTAGYAVPEKSGSD